MTSVKYLSRRARFRRCDSEPLWKTLSGEAPFSIGFAPPVGYSLSVNLWMTGTPARASGLWGSCERQPV